MTLDDFVAALTGETASVVRAAASDPTSNGPWQRPAAHGWRVAAEHAPVVSPKDDDPFADLGDDW